MTQTELESAGLFPEVSGLLRLPSSKRREEADLLDAIPPYRSKNLPLYLLLVLSAAIQIGLLTMAVTMDDWMASGAEPVVVAPPDAAVDAPVGDERTASIP